MITPIQTIYDGYRFRSRLEARWAVFFKTLGVQYEYEREGYDLGKLGWYLPDFWLPHYQGELNDGKTGIFIEVKPAKATESEFDKAYALADGLCTNVFIFEGSPWDERYNVTQIQFWDLGRIDPIVLRDLTFRFHREINILEGFPDYPYIIDEVRLENDQQHAGGFVCSPFFGMQRSQLDKALAAASQMDFGR